MKLLKLTDKNIEDEHICCAISDKKCRDGYQKKKDWLKSKFKDGYMSGFTTLYHDFLKVQLETYRVIL